MPDITGAIYGLTIVEWIAVVFTLIFAVGVVFRVLYYKNHLRYDDPKNVLKHSFNTFMSIVGFFVWGFVAFFIFSYF